MGKCSGGRPRCPRRRRRQGARRGRMRKGDHEARLPLCRKVGMSKGTQGHPRPGRSSPSPGQEFDASSWKADASGSSSAQRPWLLVLKSRFLNLAPKIRTYVWPRGWRGETGPLLEDHKGRACCTPKTHASRHDSLGACDFAGTACTRQSLVFATPFANTNICNWIYRFPANPGNAEGRRPAAHPGLGPWLGARVASPRCPILRPGDLSVAGNTLIEQFPSPRSGPDAWQRSSPASVSSWTCWHPRPAQVTLPRSRCKLTPKQA